MTYTKKIKVNVVLPNKRREEGHIQVNQSLHLLFVFLTEPDNLVAIYEFSSFEAAKEKENLKIKIILQQNKSISFIFTQEVDKEEFCCIIKSFFVLSHAMKSKSGSSSLSSLPSSPSSQEFSSGEDLSSGEDVVRSQSKRFFSSKQAAGSQKKPKELKSCTSDVSIQSINSFNSTDSESDSLRKQDCLQSASPLSPPSPAANNNNNNNNNSNNSSEKSRTRMDLFEKKEKESANLTHLINNLDCLLYPSLICSDSGSIQAVNALFCRATDYSKQDLISKKIDILMNEEHRSIHDSYLFQLEKGRRSPKAFFGHKRTVPVRCRDSRSISMTLKVVKVSSSSFLVEFF